MRCLKIQKLEYFENGKKIFNLCLRWHILRNNCFVAEVTFKNRMQKTLDTIIGEKQKLLKTEYILLHFFTICYIIYVSNKLNKTLSVIYLELIGILTFLLSISSDVETNSFTYLKMYTPISNLKSK